MLHNLLLAGFFVGVGHATGTKDETTIAANTRDLIREPLDHRWLARARRSHSAEPLSQPTYSRASLTPASISRLQECLKKNCSLVASGAATGSGRF